MKNIKKIAAIAIVFVGLVFAGNTTFAESKNINNDVMSRVAAITQLLDVMQQYPQLQQLLEPYMNKMVAELMIDLQSKVTTPDKKISTEKSVVKKEVKKVTPKKSDEKETWSFNLNDIESIDADRFESVDDKWKIEIDFKDSSSQKDIVFYVYDIDNQTELITNVLTQLEKQFGLTLTLSDIQTILDIDNDSSD